jgi:hypothetical protein
MRHTDCTRIAGKRLDTQSTLSIAAEMGIGVAGFSSLAAAIFTRSLPGKEHAQWLQFRTLLITSPGVTTALIQFRSLLHTLWNANSEPARRSSRYPDK